MKKIVFAGDSWNKLVADLLMSEIESCAVIQANVVANGDKMLASKVHVPTGGDYVERSTLSAKLKPAFIAPIVKLAVKNKQALIFVHTHPESESPPEFSLTDDKGEKILNVFLKGRGINVPNAAIVLSKGGCQARILATDSPIQIQQQNKDFQLIDCFSNQNGKMINEEFDRQIRAFGEDGQHVIQSLRVGIVGLGGTGSLVAEQLAYLGVKDFLLIDPDIVEQTNLNRLAGSTLKDIGKSKVDIAKRNIEKTGKKLVEAVKGSVLETTTAKLLVSTDIFFCCTDSHGSRAVLNQLAYQYLVPCIDMGVVINHHKGRIANITGRIQLLAPGEGCLTCTELLNSDAVRHDLMTDFERQSDPYFLGDGVVQPSVMSLNATISGLAVSMFLGVVTNIPMNSRYQIYDAIKGVIRTVKAKQNSSCIVCSRNGALGRGDEWPLPARKS